MSLLCFNFNVAICIFASLVARRRHILNVREDGGVNGVMTFVSHLS